MSKYDWLNVPKEVQWIATEFVCGEYISWGYGAKPKIKDSVWISSDRIEE